MTHGLMCHSSQCHLRTNTVGREFHAAPKFIYFPFLIIAQPLMVCKKNYL